VNREKKDKLAFLGILTVALGAFVAVVVMADKAAGGWKK